MGYRNPQEVVAPKTRWVLGKVICNTGQNGWAAAEGVWDKEPALGIRWNGDDDSGGHGSPQSHGNPTWFIVPNELEDAVRNVAANLNQTMSYIDCTIDKPKDFDYGVFQVVIEVDEKLREAIAGREVPFDLPQLANRFFRPETGFFTYPAQGENRPRGLLKGGTWRSCVQTNGIEEDKNPTKMDIVRHALIANVSKALKPYLPEKAYSSASRHSVD